MKFARGGIGAVISSNTPVHPRGLIVPNYAHLDSDDKVPFWTRARQARPRRRRASTSSSSRSRAGSATSRASSTTKGLSSTDKPDPVHGFPCERMTKAQIDEVVDSFAQAARRAREAGLDGIEIHGCNGYLITQFLSPAINDRTDEYGGSLENRARFPLEVVRAMRKEIGDDFHLQFKISAIDDGKALFPWGKEGTTLEESIQVCRWLDEAGVDGLHVSSGDLFPHPRNPAGDVPDRRRDPLLRHDALEREEHVPELPHVPHAADQQGLRVGVGAARAQATASRGSTSAGARASSRPWTSRCSAPAASRPPR